MITYVDDFCGAGGSSQGLREAGLELVQAANHNAKAIETHATNFPDADHLEADLITFNMRRRPRADVYWASPECTWHSPAGGRKRKRQMLDMFDEYVPDAAGERSRLTMMQVVAFAEAKRPKVVLVENVIEVAGWELFESWLHSMTSLGYEHQILSVSAAHVWSPENAPAPQWRDRVYFIFYQKGVPFPDVQPRPLAWCSVCGTNVHARQSWKRTDRRRIGKYRQQYTYVCPSDGHTTVDVEPWVQPAEEIIDWSDLGEKIGDRPLKEFFADKQRTRSLGFYPLAPATLRRIAVGYEMFADPMVVAHTGHTWDAAKPDHKRFGDPDSYYRVDSTADPLAARTGTPGDAVVTTTPYLFSVNHGGDDPRAFSPAEAPLPARSTKLGDAMVVPVGGTWRTDPEPVSQPFRTRTTADDIAVVSMPFMVERRDYDGPDAGRLGGVDEPLKTMTATGRGIHGVTIPEPFVTMLRANNRATGVDEPLAAMTTGRNHGVTIPDGAFVSKHHGGVDYARPEHMNKTVGEPLASVVARPNLSLVIPYRKGKPSTTRHPLHTITTVDGEAIVQVADEILDARFRMLKWREHALAQRFPIDYIFTGNGGENTMMAGNAVASNVAHYLGMLCRIALGDLAPFDYWEWETAA